MVTAAFSLPRKRLTGPEAVSIRWCLNGSNPRTLHDSPHPICVFVDRIRSGTSEWVHVAGENPQVITKLEALIAAMKDELGIDGIGPGVRELGKVSGAKPIIAPDGTIRSGFEPK